MSQHTIQIPDAQQIVVEAPDEQAALTGVQAGHTQNIGKINTNNLSSLSDDELRKLYAAHIVAGMSDKELQDAFAAHVASDKEADTSLLGALSQGTSDVVSGVGKTIKDYLSPDADKAILSTARANPTTNQSTKQNRPSLDQLIPLSR